MSAHGTRSQYVKGCHCERCRSANAAYRNSRYRAGETRPPELERLERAYAETEPERFNARLVKA